MAVPMNLCFVPAICATVLLGACSAPGISVEPHYGFLDAQGDLAMTTTGSPVVKNSLDDIGIAGEESALGLRVDIPFGSPRITLGTDSADWSGTGVVSDFGGIAGANVAVDSEMELAVHRALITFDVLPVPNFELGIGLGVEGVDLKASVIDTFSSTEEKIDELIPVPVLAARFRVHVWRLDFEALVAGMSVDVDGNQAQYFDTDLSASIKLFGMGPVEALFSTGYRRIDLNADYKDGSDSVEADLTFDGLYFGLKLSI